MPLDGLTIIGERINPGFKSSLALLEARDIDGLCELAVMQRDEGAEYLTMNTGDHAEGDPGFVRDLIRAVQQAVPLPISFDFPGREVQRLCLETYDPALADGKKPIMNSVSELRWDMLDLLGTQPFKVVLMASERLEDGRPEPNKLPQQIVDTAGRMVERLLGSGHDLAADDLLIDVSVCPIASDSEGLMRTAIEAIRGLAEVEALDGVHRLVGLSNISIMLPKEAADGSPLKEQVESAFLTLTMPHGLDFILGTPARNYRILPDDNPVLAGFRRVIEADGFDALMRVQELYQPAHAAGGAS